jgi:hypothetical protein
MTSSPDIYTPLINSATPPEGTRQRGGGGSNADGSTFVSIARTVLGAAVACACVGAGTLHVLGGLRDGSVPSLGSTPMLELDPSRVTLLAACQLVDERVPAFRSALSSWVDAARDEAGVKRLFSEVIVVDWSSEADLWDETRTAWSAAQTHTPLSFYQVRGPEGQSLPWQLTKAVNFGLSKVTTDVVLKVDCDTYLERGLRSINPLERSDGMGPDIYRYGDYRSARDENEVHTNGCLLVKMKTLRAVNFYDERLQKYGWDDSNLYERLRARGAIGLNITRRDAFGHTYINHIPHPHPDLGVGDRIISSCVNRCAVNRVERRAPWRAQRRASYVATGEAPAVGVKDSAAPITFHSFRGGETPDAFHSISKENRAKVMAICRNENEAEKVCHNGMDWEGGSFMKGPLQRMTRKAGGGG